MNEEEYKYSVGGVLAANDPTYVSRKADEDLLKYLTQKESCCVFNSRQMGKSSLIFQATEKLSEEYIWAIVDLSKNSFSDTKQEQWYQSVANYIKMDINGKITGFDWNWESDERQPQEKFQQFLNQLLDSTQKNIVIFFDEIDSVTKIEIFKPQDLFVTIRCFYQQIKKFPRNNYIAFCLIGVATPRDLIQDKNTTPFNIGERIEMGGFTFEEAKKSLSFGLEKKFGSPDQARLILQEVIYWTNGQPLLTQLLCQILVENPKEDEPDIKTFVKKYVDNYLCQNETYSEHIGHIEDQIKKNNELVVSLLTMYKQILEYKQRNEYFRADNTNREQIALRLSGLVIKTKGKDGLEYLEPFNRLYEKKFDIEWVNEQLEKVKPYSQELKSWQTAHPNKKQLYLLYGEDLEKHEEWRKDKNIDIEFFKYSQKFWDDALKNIPKGSNYASIIKEMNKMTEGYEFFNDIIFEIFSHQDKNKRIEPGSEKQAVDKAVEKIKKASGKTAYLKQVKEHQEEIELCFIDNKDSTIDTFWLLLSYREIWQRGEVEFNESPEHKKLETMCLIIKESNKLKILNKIYSRIFDRDWFYPKLLVARPYFNSFIHWQDSSEDKSHLLQKDDLERSLTWLQNNEISKELEIKFIITSLIGEIWQSAKEEEKSKAVDIIIKVNPQLKGKTNPLYGFIQKVLEHTASDCDLLEKLLEKACEQKNIRSEQQDKWIEEQLRLLNPNDISKEEILAWIKSYEKAIVAKNPQYSKAKEIIDIAFCELVKQLAEFPNHTKPQNSDIDTVIHCINYLADNLIRLGIWEEDDRPNIKQEGENRWKITVSNCSYQEECKWALDEPTFVDKENEPEKYKKYRCQRLGCCVGAVKKNITDNNFPVDQKNQLDYFMTTVMESTEEAEKKCRCEGVIFVNKNLER